MKKIILSSLAVLVAVGSVNAFEAKPKNTTCLVSGEEINKTGAKAKIVKVGGEDVALCCGGCLKKTTKMAESERKSFLFSDKSFKKGYVLANTKK